NAVFMAIQESDLLKEIKNTVQQPITLANTTTKHNEAPSIIQNVVENFVPDDFKLGSVNLSTIGDNAIEMPETSLLRISQLNWRTIVNKIRKQDKLSNLISFIGLIH
ncbi:unnamed protein product, partial [Rotaria socialis]